MDSSQQDPFTPSNLNISDTIRDLQCSAHYVKCSSNIMTYVKMTTNQIRIENTCSSQQDSIVTLATRYPILCLVNLQVLPWHLHSKTVLNAVMYLINPKPHLMIVLNKKSSHFWLTLIRRQNKGPSVNGAQVVILTPNYKGCLWMWKKNKTMVIQLVIVFTYKLDHARNLILSYSFCKIRFKKVKIRFVTYSTIFQCFSVLRIFIMYLCVPCFFLWYVPVIKFRMPPPTVKNICKG